MMTERRNVVITDLDAIDNPSRGDLMKGSHRKFHKRRSKEKTLNTFSGNFNRRAHSSDCRVINQNEQTVNDRDCKVSNYFKEVLQSKDKQMGKLLERLTTVHKFNEQFAEENQQLQNDVKNMEQRILTLQRQIADCQRCHHLENDLLQQTKLNKSLEDDIEMMKKLTYRLNVQIEHYQDKLRLNNSNVDDLAAKTPSTPKDQAAGSRICQWQDGALSTHTLSPLLQAYDEMLSEKDELIQQYTQEFDHFSGELKSVIEENNRLQEQIEQCRREFGDWREEKARLQAQLDVCRQKAETQTRKTDLAKEKLVEVMHCYEQKIQTITLDLDHLQSAYTRCKSELASIKSANAIPQDGIVKSLKECKELLEQLKVQHHQEKTTLEQNLKEMADRNCNLELCIEKLKTENTGLQQNLEQSNNQFHILKQNYSTLKTTNEKLKRSRDSLKARLRIALQWTQKLEDGQANLQNTWDALRRLETIVKHKESQVRGLHARHLEEIQKMQQKLAQKDETIKSILRDKLSRSTK